jgi:hypothetical protein
MKNNQLNMVQEEHERFIQQLKKKHQKETEELGKDWEE